MLVTLTAGTCVLLFLNSLWLAAEKSAIDEHRQSQFVEQLNDMLNSWALLSGTSIVGAVEKDWQETVKKQHPWLWFKFYELKNITKDRPAAHAQVLKLEQISKQEIEACANLPQSNAGLTLEMARTLPKALAKIYQLRTEAKRILVCEQLELQHANDKQKRSFEYMKLFAYGFAAANVLLALLLLWLFSRSISHRIQILAKNAAALPRTPQYRLHGNDELAYLDKVLRQTSESLQAAAEHRRSILGMVAHDMRSPLMSSQVNIHMIEEIGGDYPDGSYESLEEANNKLSSILTFVQELLTVQKAEDEEPVAPGLEGVSTDTAGSDSIGSASLESNSPESNSIESNLVESNSVQSNLVQSKSGSSDLIREDLLSHSATLPKSSLNDASASDCHPGLSANRLVDGLKEFLTKPKIFHKGLIVVLGPLLLQAGLLLFINQQLVSTENLAAGEHRCGEIGSSSSIIKMDMFRAAATRGIYLITSSSTAENLANKIIAELWLDYDKLSNIVGPSEDWQHYIKLARTNQEHQIQKMISLSPSSDQMEKYDTFAEISEIKQKSPEALEVRTIANALLKKNVASLHAMELEQEKLAALISKLIGFGIFANFLIAIGMLYFFTKNITDRIIVLASNAAKIGKGEELNYSAAGTDELAYLGLILQQAKSQLDLASQQRAMMMASLAQQMRVPLQAARGELDKFSRLAEKSMSQNAQKHLARAEGNIQKVLRLVDDLLTMESLESGKVALELSACDIRTIAEDALSTVGGLAKAKNITLMNLCNHADLLADRARLGQVLINYLSNAIKFSPPDTQIKICTAKSDAGLKVSVIDEGPGMDTETRNRVFEKFFQANTAEKKQGFGLGLAICQLIVHSHGGQLGVESEVGKGSAFWFELPLNSD